MNYKKQIAKIAEVKGAPCVSIYIDTNITGDYEANRIKWKNAINDAKNILDKKGVENTSFLNSAFDLLDNPDFWANRSNGLCGFYNKDIQITIDMMSKPILKTIVSENFHFTPLIEDSNLDDRLYLLNISKNQVRLFEASSSGIIPIIIKDKIPSNFDEALNLDIYKVALQSRGSGQSTYFHNSGSHTDKENVRLEQYLRTIDQGVIEIIDYAGEPLVIACVEEYYPIYQSITKYPNFSAHMLAGNFDDVHPAELWNQLQPVFEEMKQQKLTSFENEYKENEHQNRTAAGYQEVLKYGENHQIKSILINPNVLTSDENLSIQNSDIDDLLLNLYNENVDIIFSKELEIQEPVKAILRY